MSDLACEIQLISKTIDTNHSNATNKQTDKHTNLSLFYVIDLATNKQTQTGKQTGSAFVVVRLCLQDETELNLRFQRYQSKGIF